MSTNPSIIFYKGLRCTKVPRKPRATDPALTSTSSIISHTPEEDPTSSREKALPDPSAPNKHTATATVAPARTTSSSSSDTEPSLSSQATSQDSDRATSRDSKSQSSYLNISTASNPTTTHTTFITETTTTIQTTTRISSPIPSTSDDDSTDPPYATIFGSLFGALLFIALIAIIIFLYFRRRRSRQTPSAGPWNVPRIFRDDRASTGSRTSLQRDFKPVTSYLADASPTPSALLKTSTKPYSDNPDYHIKNQPRDSDPFSDLAEVRESHDYKSSNVSFIMRSSAVGPDTSNEYPSRPAETHFPDRDSMQSGTSLGSTLVLPGRSSFGSEYQENSLSFPKSPSTGYSYPRAVVRLGDTHSDPFDLYLDDTPSNKQISAFRRSSGTIPVVLI
ncbi:hypothetical protein BJX70DRAFT_336222 [Aspergillus crustosus]